MTPPDTTQEPTVREMTLQDTAARDLPIESVRVDGRHLVRHGSPFRVKGVTYGSFRPREDGQLFPPGARIAQDLHHMASLGLNTVRTYSLPPVELLDIAADLDVQVLVGLHYDDWRMHAAVGRRVHRRVLDAGRQAVDDALERLEGRSNVLAVSVGNEVPADLVRLHGIAPVEETLSRLVQHVRDGDPQLLATYCNYPTTEYLHVDDLDFTCFNVFLEHPEQLRAYVRRLHTVAGSTPLLLTELGLASEIHGGEAQAETLDWQLRIVDETGCAGATVFAWTDEWAVDGEDVPGWGFGLTTVEREEKSATAVVRQWAKRDIAELRESWPSLSVIVCAYNEERLLHECLDSLLGLDYPNLEVIVCDDGSTDATLQIAAAYPFKVVALPHEGLSAARNAGLRAAKGAIVAYVDADAHCHPEWAYHVALSLEDPGVVATGGPNLPVTGAAFVERAVAGSPGGPVEVLVADDRAEHVPGCNMAFVRAELEAIGGFDAVYTSAGDDVDVCWKLLDRGSEIAFSPAAQVHHHRRSTVKGYLRQQRGYGQSERMVATRHPHRFNRLGQARWAGAIYGGLRHVPSVLRPVVYHGPLGTAPFQAVVHRPGDALFACLAAALPLSIPIAVLGLLLSGASRVWLLPVAMSALVVVLYGATVAAAATPHRNEQHPIAWRALVAFLHVVQPFVRTWGRLRGPRLPRPEAPDAAWDGDRLTWISSLERHLTAARTHVRYEAPASRWDLTAAVGPFFCAKVATAVQWSWTPVATFSVMARWPRMVALAAGVGLVTSAGLPLVVSSVAAVAVLAAEYVLLVRRLRTALAVTTARAAPSHD